MGQTARTTKLLLDLFTREQGGANAGKREHLAATVEILNAARRFYLTFFLAHPDKLTERVTILSKKTDEVREGVISAENLLTWAEFQTVATREHPDPLPDWNFSHAFPDFPNRYRRCVIKDSIGKARGYLGFFAYPPETVYSFRGDMQKAPTWPNFGSSSLRSYGSISVLNRLSYILSALCHKDVLQVSRKSRDGVNSFPRILPSVHTRF
jgi:hypothetical protein